jgi:hypothetical protein
VDGERKEYRNDYDSRVQLISMRWLYLGFTVLCLWVAFNALFMLPGNYDAFSFWAAGVAIAISVICAVLGGKRFAAAGRGKRRGRRIWLTPPVVACAIGLTFLVLAILNRIIYSRWP